MSEIYWPKKYLPGTTDNFVSNEVIVKELSTSDVWPYLNDTTFWPTYYSNASNIGFDGGAGPELSSGVRFRFTTFGLNVEAEVTEYVPPVAGQAARVAWRAWVDGPEDQALDVLHAWLIEDLPGGRVRVLTQESQIGKPAQAMALAKPNPMLNAHQDWLEGLIHAVKSSKA
ncbi:SRPBCC domain-containing protein [Silvibacterium sp.]|uniref:SRPBCC domain-containing protein n=1 Tax=Silvibacterium sp. TaxID=1964179 RepID=UPI0039E70507